MQLRAEYVAGAGPAVTNRQATNDNPKLLFDTIVVDAGGHGAETKPVARTQNPPNPVTTTGDASVPSKSDVISPPLTVKVTERLENI